MSEVNSSYGAVASIKCYPAKSSPFNGPVYESVEVASAVEAAAVDKVAKDIPLYATKDNLPKLSVKVSTALHGDVHTVTLEFSVALGYAQYKKDLLETLQTMATEPHEFLVRFLGGERCVVRTDPDAYRFRYRQDGFLLNCTATMNNGQGLTLLPRA